MANLIPDASNKKPLAVRFGRELGRAMARSGHGTRTVAEAAGVGRSSVMNWRAGRVLPKVEHAALLADALSWPRLASLASELRRKECEVCGRAFTDDTGSDNRRYCDDACLRVAEKRRKGLTVDKRAAVAERRLLAYVRAVAANCAGCEPAGLCRDLGCALRPVSPLPLHREAAA